MLEDVVVVGFGTQSRRTLTGSVSRIRGDEVAQIASTNFQSALQGLAPGLSVANSSGMAGAPVRVRVRGTGSIFSSGDPLYIIDGVPVDAENSGLFANTGRGGAPPANPMSNIDPNDVESIEVLKDAAASAIYGARAANGVLLITTKKGKSGKTRINVNVSYGFNEATNKVDYLNGKEYMDLRAESIRNSLATGITFQGNLGGVPAIWLNGGYNQWFSNAVPPLNYDSSVAAQTAAQNINHFEDVFRKGKVITSSISAAGGNDRTQFFLSGNYQGEEGILHRNDFKRFSGRANVDHRINDRFKIGTQVSGSYSKNGVYPIGPLSQFAGGFNPGGFLNATNSVLPIFPKRNPNGTLFGVPQTVNNLVYLDENLYFNTVEQQRYLANIYGEYTITRGLTFRSEVGTDFVNQVNRLYMNPTITAGGTQGTLQGVADSRSRSSNTLNTNTYFTYKTGYKDHSFDVVAGSQYTGSTTRSSWIQGNLLPAAPTLNTTQVAGQISAQDRLDEFSYLSFFGRVNYNYKRKYLLGASVRRDGSSRFGANNRWANFPSLSAGWVLSEESFLRSSKAVSLLKLRASWGLTGNSNPGGVEPIAYGGYGIGGAFYGGAIGYPFRRVPALADNIRWERTEMIDLALDFGFFRNRINGSVNYYRRNTSDLILGAAPPPASGIVGGRNFANIASLRNDGIELNIGSKIIDGKNFKWQVDLNAAYNQNEVVSLGGLAPTAVAFGVNRTFVGMPLSTYWLPMYLGVDPQTGFEVYAGRMQKDGKEVLDANGYPVHDPNNRIVVDPFGRINGTTTNVNWEGISAPVNGKPGLPVWSGGLSNTLSYKGLSFAFLFTFNQGNWIYDEGARTQAFMLQTYRNVRREFVENRWQRPGDIASNPGVFFNPITQNQQSTRFLYRGDFIRLRNVRLSYNLPVTLTRRLRMDRVNFFVNATNLLLFTKFPGWDPEVVGTIGFQDFNNQPQNIAAGQTNSEPPQARNITFGLQLGF
ncbi:TonB-dependent receptor [Flaviaesturariibacter amylovorans]|uniref:TonB-dependent receptor n=2 Tax=Flaviaesturariibacter amylovorans TaxID=1084520 RepID=A0ABP8H714_9BACT